MNQIDYFEFEYKDKDFPFYNSNPPISFKGWILLFFAFLLGLLFILGSSMGAEIKACIVLIIPVLYLLNWDYELIFQKPKAKDILLAIGLFIGYVLYSFLLFNLFANHNAPLGGPVTFMSMLPLIFSVMAEEFIKFIPFIFLLNVFYKYSQNRKLSIIISALLIMIFFAFIHSFNLALFISAIFFQGIGSIFEFIGYIKTKNLLIPYITHICTDIFFVLLIMFGIRIF